MCSFVSMYARRKQHAGARENARIEELSGKSLKGNRHRLVQPPTLMCVL